MDHDFMVYINANLNASMHMKNFITVEVEKHSKQKTEAAIAAIGNPAMRDTYFKNLGIEIYLKDLLTRIK